MHEIFTGTSLAIRIATSKYIHMYTMNLAHTFEKVSFFNLCIGDDSTKANQVCDEIIVQVNIWVICIQHCLAKPGPSK